MTDKPLDAVGFRSGIQQLGKHDFRGTSLPPCTPPTDFEVIHADEIAALRWVRANREAVEALLAGWAAVVPVQIGDNAMPYRASSGYPLAMQFDLARVRLDKPEAQP